MKASLPTTHPELASQWHPTKNGELTPGMLVAGSNKKVWWLGSCGHSWEATVKNRSGLNRGCPYCANQLPVPGVNDLATTNPDLVGYWSDKNPFLPSQVFRNSEKKVIWCCPEGHEWEDRIRKVANRSTVCLVCDNITPLPGFNDLATTHPHLAAQWHPTKNESLEPSSITFKHPKPVWWLCEKNHEWEAKIKGANCPYCNNRKVMVGFNDLATSHPLIAKQWHPTRNKELAPAEVTAGSGKKVWWLCEKNHEWQTTLVSRTTYNLNCPYCSNRKLLVGFNDLATTHPHIAKQWHPENNNTKQPSQFLPGSHEQIWWVCELGHEWRRPVNGRTRDNSGCPYCAGKQVKVGFNDLATTHPHLIPEWHPTKNLLTPDAVTGGSHKRTWWLGECGHEWETKTETRTRDKAGCKKCQQPVSKNEQQIRTYLKDQLKQEIDVNNRDILPNNQELDIYLPEHNIAIEFNGLYWHTEKQGKTKKYHYDKWLKCKEKGIQLIQIWEDDWNRNPELIKRMLAHKLGVSQERKVYARETKIVNLNRNETQQFLNNNHIQGYATGSHYLGLKENKKNELVAVMVLKKEPGTDGKTLNIVRYATSVNVVGGFTKLLKHAERTHNPEKFITFSDNNNSNGNLYQNNGFTPTKQLPPDYTYLYQNRRHHKFKYRLKKIRDNPNLIFEENLTEKQLAHLNNLPRIWDAGKIKWEKHR